MSLTAARGFAPVGPAIAAAGLVGLLGGVMTLAGAGWSRTLLQPAWQPPGWLFGPVWSLLFGLLALSFATAWAHAPDTRTQRRIVALFALNGVFNVAWSGLFFGARRPDWAAADVVLLWLSIAVMIAALTPVSKRASVLLLPYLCWVSFAAVLNFEIVRLNAPFG